MIKYVTAKVANAMQRRYNYDASYMREVAAVSSGGAVRLGLLPLFSQYSAGVPAALWAGTAIGSTLDGDCGPCAQLVVDTALERGVPAELLRAGLAGDWPNAGLVGLGMRFARASISDSPELDEVREEIRDQFGDRAIVTLSIAAATGRSWPVIKRGLGHGKICQSLRINDVNVDLARVEASPAA